MIPELPIRTAFIENFQQNVGSVGKYVIFAID